MFSLSNLSNMLRTVASALQIPVIIFLLLLLAATVVMVGTLIAEFFTERLWLKVKLPALVDRIRAQDAPLEKIIIESGLLKRQKKALLEIISHSGLTPLMRESLAVELLREEKEYYETIVKVSDVISRIGPMFGLLGTLIPLGPGIIALGRGDTYTLSTSLLTAFDTTIAGLIAAAFAFVISAIRKKWYSKYMGSLETVMECILEAVNGNA